MPDLETMLAAYAASYPDETDRLILADWLEERGDVRGSWLRDPDLARYLGPTLAQPTPELVLELLRLPCGEELLRKFGRAALPALVACYHPDGDQEVQNRIHNLLPEGCYAPELRDLPWHELDAPETKLRFLHTLRSRGVAAAPAVMTVLRELHHDSSEGSEVRAVVLDILAGLGPVAPAALAQAAQRLGWRDRDGHALLHDRIVQLGSTSPAAELLVEDLNHPDEAIVASALAALRRYGPEVVEILLAHAGGLYLDYDVHRLTFEFLPDGAEIDERLLATAQNRTREAPERIWAIRALVERARRGAVPPGVVRAQVLELLGDADDTVTSYTAEAVVAGWVGAAAVPTLLRLLARNGSSGRRTVVDTLRHIGAPARNLVPLAWSWLADADASFRTAVREFLRSFLSPVEIVQEVGRRATDADAGVRVTAVRWFAVLADMLPEWTGLVWAALADAEASVRRAAAEEAVAALDRSAGSVFPWLELLRHADPAVCVLALEALYEREALWPLLIPELERLADHDAPAVRLALWGRVGLLGWLHEGSLPAFAALVQRGRLDPVAEIREIANLFALPGANS